MFGRMSSQLLQVWLHPHRQVGHLPTWGQDFEAAPAFVSRDALHVVEFYELQSCFDCFTCRKPAQEFELYSYINEMVSFSLD